MSNLATVNPLVLDAVQRTREAVVDVAKAEGNGMAHQAVAQATAIAIQDATEYMRNVQAIAVATLGVALELILQDQRPAAAAAAIEQAQKAITSAAENFKVVGQNATEIINSYPAS